jgi:hypothetical protein
MLLSKQTFLLQEVDQRIFAQSVIVDQLNPSWAAAITVDYMFEITQEVRVIFHQRDSLNMLMDISSPNLPIR